MSVLRWCGRLLTGRSDQLVKAVRTRFTLPYGVTGVVLVAVAISLPLLLLTGWQQGSAQPGTMLDRLAGEPTAEGTASGSREPPRPRAAPPLDTPLDAPPAALPDEPVVPDNPESAPAEPAPEFLSWAVIDLGSGTITGSDTMTATSTTASMIKVWLVADYLRLAADAGDEPTPERLTELRFIVRDSHNEHTHELFDELGKHASIERLIGTCGLTDSSAAPNSWSNTLLSARDTARLGACLADGRALGGDQRWTAWLLDEMRAVRGAGDFGIRHALPAGERAGVAIKNGWVIRSNEGAWHVNCLAIGDGWAMGVLLRYPTTWGFEHGAELCRATAEEFLLPRLS